jgi:PHD/YefM family antitoxin component YafN of YafNO toxin-antitoxin module
MTNIVSIEEVESGFRRLLLKLKKGKEQFVVDNDGKPQAILMSIKDYIDKVTPEPAWLKRIGEASKRRGVSKLTKREIKAEIAAARKQIQSRAR